MRGSSFRQGGTPMRVRTVVGIAIAALLPAMAPAQEQPAAAAAAAAAPAPAQQPSAAAPTEYLTGTPAQQPAAAPAAEARASSERRVLGGHQFLSSHLVEDPFSVTSFALNFGLGTGEALGPKLDLSTSPPTLLADSKWYGYAELAQQFDFTARVFEYLSLHAGITSGLRQGLGNGSGLVVGTSLGVNALLGVKGSVPVGDTLRLSLSAEDSWGPKMNLLILQGIRNAINSGSFESVDVFKDRKATTFASTAAAAWGPTPWLGLVANARYLHAKSADISESSQDGYAAAGVAEFDFRPLVGWLPVGLSAAYQRVGSLGGTSGLAEQDMWSWGVFYTGRRDLSLGLEVEHVQGRLDTDLKSKQTGGWIDLRYYW